MDDRDLMLDAARALRGDLHRLHVEEAHSLDEQLGRLIVEVAQGDRNAEELAALLRSHPDTNRFAEHFLLEGVPPGVTVYRAKSVGPPGRPRRISATKWSCPSGDFDFFRRSPREPVPLCPTHRIALVPADPGTTR